jgi:hypothetical protein
LDSIPATKKIIIMGLATVRDRSVIQPSSGCSKDFRISSREHSPAVSWLQGPWIRKLFTIGACNVYYNAQLMKIRAHLAFSKKLFVTQKCTDTLGRLFKTGLAPTRTNFILLFIYVCMSVYFKTLENKYS